MAAVAKIAACRALIPGAFLLGYYKVIAPFARAGGRRKIQLDFRIV